MRNMSFFYTQHQIRFRTKTVTRRRGWKNLKRGERFRAVVKGQGLKKGEQVRVLAVLECVSNEPEPLHEITRKDVEREGFPDMTADEFVEMFCRHMGGDGGQEVSRIEFKYV